MSFSVNTYSPTDVTLSFGGYVLTGWNTINIQRVYAGMTAVDGISFEVKTLGHNRPKGRFERR